MMNTPTKKFIVAGGALVVLVLVSCGLTGCKLPWSKGGNQGDSTVTNTSTAEIPGLVPDPGEAGKATLAGIITNPKGVRDDIYNFILTNHQDSEKTREALFQYAKVVQNALLDANDKQKSVKHGEEVSRASECLTYVLGNDVVAARESYNMKRDLRPIILNTDARNKAYFGYNKLLRTEYFPGTPDSQIASTCDFNAVSLPN